MKLATPLQTPRLQLRSLTAEDATQRYLGWLTDPEVNRYLEARFAEHSLESLRQFIEACNSGVADLLLGICLADGRHIGNIKLGPVDPHHKNAAIGLLIGERDCWGLGYASEAIGCVTAHAFAAMDIEKLYAGCYVSNVGSARAFIDAGWYEEGRSKGYWFREGKREDNIQFGITRAEWQAHPR